MWICWLSFLLMLSTLGVLFVSILSSIKISSQAALPTDLPDLCGENEVFKDCAPTCEPTCRFPDVKCEDSCEDNVCRCKEGYIRSEMEGPCIPASACPPSPTDFLDVTSLMPTCDGVVCDGNTHCEIVDLPCVDSYCPQEAVCVDDV